MTINNTKKRPPTDLIARAQSRRVKTTPTPTAQEIALAVSYITGDVSMAQVKFAINADKAGQGAYVWLLSVLRRGAQHKLFTMTART